MKIEFNIELKEYQGQDIELNSKKHKKLDKQAEELLKGIADALKKVFNQGKFTNPQINYKIIANE